MNEVLTRDVNGPGFDPRQVHHLTMKQLSETTDYNTTIKLAKNLTGSYDTPVTFHCYWNGNLNEKHLYSVLSCYHFNVLNRKHKIVLWVENNKPNEINKQVSKYCEIKQFNFDNEKQSLNYTTDIRFRHNKEDLTEYADCIRLLLLYNYGGCWFDLDCLFLRSFDTIFKNYEKEVCVYQWGKQNYPNNAIVISLVPKSSNLKNIIDFFHYQNTGWRTQSNCTYSSPLDMLVLPCSWFDPAWIDNPYNRKIGINKQTIFNKTEIKYNFDNFFPGSYCFHWHNKWDKPIEKNSILEQLISIFYNKSCENVKI